MCEFYEVQFDFKTNRISVNVIVVSSNEDKYFGIGNWCSNNLKKKNWLVTGFYDILKKNIISIVIVNNNSNNQQ